MSDAVGLAGRSGFVAATVGLETPLPEVDDRANDYGATVPIVETILPCADGAMPEGSIPLAALVELGDLHRRFTTKGVTTPVRGWRSLGSAEGRAARLADRGR